jgi:hypothetical protein
MYVNPYICGAVATILVELAAMFIWATVSKRGGKK